MPELRDYQLKTIADVRQAIAEGERRIVVQLPTAAGKTLLSAEIIKMARVKGNQAIFVVPALSLIDQTVQRFESAGIPSDEIGVLQGNHERTNWTRPVQVASVQTLQRRNIPKAAIVIIDEVHINYAFYEKWLNDPEWLRVPFIGLSATPWAKGMGKLWKRLIICTTTSELIERGYLSPFKVFAPSKPDLSGVRIVAGDYETEGLSEVMSKPKLVGDIVQTWLDKGRGRPTLCFAVDRTHAKHLQERFAAAGVSIEYQDAFTDREERAAITQRFTLGYTEIIVNVATLIVGVDLDVRCIIFARPTRSAMLFTQAIGRGLRTAPGKEFCTILDHSDTTERLGFVTDIHFDCLSRDTLVLTARGEVKIQEVTLDDRLWDGQSFVSHGGAVHKGVQTVISYDGITATPDHEVMTDDGWLTLSEASRGQVGITRTGIGGVAIRLSNDHVTINQGPLEHPSSGCPLRSMRSKPHGAFYQSETSGRRDKGLPPLQSEDSSECSRMALSALQKLAESLFQSARNAIRGLRRAWHRVSLPERKRGCKLGSRESWNSRSIAPNRPDQQQRPLRAGEPALEYAHRASEQHPKESRRTSALHKLPTEPPRDSLCRQYSAAIDLERADRRGDHAAMDIFPGVEVYAEVWDILNAGPLQRFTANGRLVHNCLDDGTKKEASERQPPKPKACPQCTALYPASSLACPNCGFRPTPRVQAPTESAPGELFEVTPGKGKKAGQDYSTPQREQFYRELLCHAKRKGYQEGWAFHAYKEKFKVGPASFFQRTPAGFVSFEVDGWIKHMNIRRAKSRAKASA